MSINYYVLTDDDCKYEAMTKEQTITAIEQAVENGVVSDPDGAVISKIKEIRANGIAQIWLGTEAQFNALSPAPSVGYTFVRVGANGIMYICTDDQTSSNLLNHATNKNNPHEVTAAQIGAATESALAAKATTARYTATIPASGWSASNTVTVAVSGILASDTPIVDIVQTGTSSTDETMRENWVKITRITTAANSITVYASEVPSASIPIQLKVVR